MWCITEEDTAKDTQIDGDKYNYFTTNAAKGCIKL